jgi:AcrR family transcriptional regulator
MVANRGYESTGAKTRHRLIEAASELLADEGYVAFTARRIAARAELKPQLVHYYFRSMEELVVTVFQRTSAIYFRLHDEALSSPRPLRSLWELNSNMPEARNVLEFVALGKQYPSLREEMRKSGESFRALQIEAIERVYADRGNTDPQITAPALATMMSAIARTMVLENQVGMDMAHDATRAMMVSYLATLEG